MPESVCKQVSQLRQTAAEHMIINTVETALNWRLETVVITLTSIEYVKKYSKIWA